MGSLTEAFAYLNEGSKTEFNIKEKQCYITITPELKALKKYLGWHLINEKQNKPKEGSEPIRF